MAKIFKSPHDWPRGPFSWSEGRTLFVSVPFTWNLPAMRAELEHGSLEYDRVRVGGPATTLMPDFLTGIPGVEVGGDVPGVLQRIQPLATRSTTGCPRKCSFCGIGKGLIEPGGFQCLTDWPDLPIQADNNLFAAPVDHFDRVIERLKVWGWADFNQGVDHRFLTDYHARRIAEIGKPLVRLALDSDSRQAKADWLKAFRRLRRAGLPKSAIRSYALVGFSTGPAEAWERCRWIESRGIKVAPMWYHRLDALEYNAVTEDQQKLGWSDEQRKDMMMYYYQHLVRANRREKRFHHPDQMQLAM